jgi:glycosyltransferase involved in cell wall biosynthesis
MRLAIVIQRYGAEINGGAELHARLLAQRLAPRHEVQVLSSCANNYQNWQAHYPEGDSVEDGIAVRRFANPPRNHLGRARVPLQHKLRYLARRALRSLVRPLVAQPTGEALCDGESFLRHQGPFCEGLFEHLAQSGSRYDAVIFFAALYAPAAVGLRCWAGPRLLIPLLHDEKPMYLPVFHEVFAQAHALVFNTAAEQALAQRLYGPQHAHQCVAGVGIDLVAPDPETVAETLARFGLGARGVRYLVYVGRIDTAKGCEDLLHAFAAWAQRDPLACLVLVGKAHMPIEAHPRLICTGFVSDTDRDCLIVAAAGLVIPSRYESLSLVALEAMALGVPVLANGNSEVMAAHVQDSGCGLLFHSRRQLRGQLQRLYGLPQQQRLHHAQAGQRYVAERYTWAAVLHSVEGALAAAVHAASAQNTAPPRARGI